MNFTQSVSYCLTNYFNFDGRGSRSEYWWFYVAWLIADAVSAVVDTIVGYPILGLVVSLGSICPTLAAGARRLHDTDRSGWWQLLVFFPIIGWIWMIVLLASRGTPGPNRFGAAAPGA